MAGRLTRFLNLERARKPGDTPAHGVVSRERFSGESPPQAPPDDPFREPFLEHRSLPGL